MDNYKKILNSLVKKYKDTLTSSYEYVTSHRLIKKIEDSIINDEPNSIRINYDKLCSITEEEMAMFTSLDCVKIVKSIPLILKMSGFKNRDASVLKNLLFLREDLLNNRFKSFSNQEKSINVLSKIINEELYKKNSNIVLDFIKLSFDSGLIDTETSINLLFYILENCNDYGLEKTNDIEVEVVELEKNDGSVLDNRRKLEDLFSKYGYDYDRDALNCCGGEDNFVKYSNIGYVDYILSKFKRYGIVKDELYRKKAFYNIIIDNDKESFNSILDFVDHNDCSLSKLLYLPSIFSKRNREYVMKDKSDSRKGPSNSNLKISGSNNDFFKNIRLYMKLKGIDVVTNEDLDEISKFVSTSHSLIQKNINLLLKYNIITKDQLPESIVSLCGIRTEYLIDRFIESSLYESYLLPKVDGDKLLPSVGTSRLYLTTSDLMFYKIKRAQDLGDTVLRSNGWLKGVFSNDKEEYMGIRLERDGKKFIGIVQDAMSMEDMDNIDPSIKKWLPDRFYSNRDISWEDAAKMQFNNLYKYNVYSPINIFGKDSIKGELIDRIFNEDFKNVNNSIDILDNEFVKLLDNSIYCDAFGNDRKLRTSSYQYEFIHPSFPNMRVVISRNKVLRLCKLLHDNDCWINNNTSMIDKENILLSVIVKDSILSDYEVVMIRMVVRSILTNGLVKVPNAEYINIGRGARR